VDSSSLGRKDDLARTLGTARRALGPTQRMPRIQRTALWMRAIIPGPRSTKKWAGVSLSVSPDLLFLLFPFFIQAAQLGGQLFLQLFHLIELSLCLLLGDLALQQQFFLGDLGRVKGIDFGHLSALLSV